MATFELGPRGSGLFQIRHSRERHTQAEEWGVRSARSSELGVVCAPERQLRGPGGGRAEASLLGATQGGRV